MAFYKCKVCGKVFEVKDGETPECPVCHVKGDKLELFTGNPYKGTQTEKNLEAAFAGESQARNKYTYFASKAKKSSSRPPRTRRSMPSSGSRSSAESALPRRT